MLTPCAVEYTGLIAVTDDDLSRSGKSAAPSMLKYKKGGGYAAELQVVHELHCLVWYCIPG